MTVLRQICRFITVCIFAGFITACESVPHDSNQKNWAGRSLVHEMGLPSGYDIYLGYAAVKGVRSGYEDLKKVAPDFAKKKCGENSSYELVDLKIRPWVFCCPARMAYFFANIRCGSLNAPEPIPMQRISISDAKIKCQELGFERSSTQFSECVKELTE